MKLDLLIITQCPVCFKQTGAVYTVRSITRHIKHACKNCGSLLRVPLSDNLNTEIIRKGNTRNAKR